MKKKKKSCVSNVRWEKNISREWKAKKESACVKHALGKTEITSLKRLSKKIKRSGGVKSVLITKVERTGVTPVLDNYITPWKLLFLLFFFCACMDEISAPAKFVTSWGISQGLSKTKFPWIITRTSMRTVWVRPNICQIVTLWGFGRDCPAVKYTAQPPGAERHP